MENTTGRRVDLPRPGEVEGGNNGEFRYLVRLATFQMIEGASPLLMLVKRAEQYDPTGKYKNGECDGNSTAPEFHCN